MRKHALTLGLCTALLAAGAVALNAADEKPPDYKPIVQHAEKVGKMDFEEAKKGGKEVTKAYAESPTPLLDMMTIFKLRTSQVPGIGMGAKPGAITPDGIEAWIITKQRRPLPSATLQKHKKDIARAAEMAAAMASIAAHMCPVQKKVGQQDPKKWAEFSKDMYKSAKELAAAANTPKPDPDKVKAAIQNLNRSCVDCHAIFRQ